LVVAACHLGLCDDLVGFVVEGADFEEFLHELTATDQVADLDCDGGFADVPELVDGGHGAEEVVDPERRDQCQIQMLNETEQLTCSRSQQ